MVCLAVCAGVGRPLLGCGSLPGGEAGEGNLPSRGPLPRGPGLSLEKAQTKEHQGLRPLDPGREGRRFLPSRSPSLGCGNGKGRCSVGVTGLRPTQRKAPRRAAHHLGGWGTLFLSLWGKRKKSK